LPKVSSGNRKYILITFLDKSIIAGDKIYLVEKGELYHLGVLLSDEYYMQAFKIWENEKRLKLFYFNSL
jgi:hypothetical protein